MKRRWASIARGIALMTAFGQVLVGPAAVNWLSAEQVRTAGLSPTTLQSTRTDDLPATILEGPVSAVGIALARADVALARSLITPSLLRGDVSERLVIDVLLREHLVTNGDWRMIRPRLGSQGIDGVLIKFDDRGNPRQLMVAETKYNTARLGMTKDGLQMSRQWRNTRLKALAGRYLRLGEQLAGGNLIEGSAPRSLSPHERLDIPLPQGRNAVAWREGNGPWHLDLDGGARENFPAQVQKLSTFLNGTADGRITYRSLVFEAKPTGERLVVVVRNASTIDAGARALAQLPEINRFEIPLTGSQGLPAYGITQNEIARSLSRKLPNLPEEDLEAFAATLSQESNLLGEADGSTMGNGITGRVFHTSIASGVLVAALDPIVTVIFQRLTTGMWRIENPTMMAESTALVFGSSTIGVAAGQTTVLVLTRNSVLNQFATRCTGELGLSSTTVFANASGEFVGGSVASILYPFVAYELGWMDAQSARRSGIAGIAGSAAVAATWAGTMSLIAAYGTASTGVAISSLSGAAAGSASLAWLGGGSLAAGGGGIAVGSIVATGGLALIAIGVTGGVVYCFHYYDQSREIKRIQLMIQALKAQNDFPNGLSWSARKVDTRVATSECVERISQQCLDFPAI